MNESNPPPPLIPESLLALPVSGRNLPGPLLRDSLAGGPVLLAFVRHLG
jgi:hypothetical protein